MHTSVRIRYLFPIVIQLLTHTQMSASDWQKWLSRLGGAAYLIVQKSPAKVRLFRKKTFKKRQQANNAPTYVGIRRAQEIATPSRLGGAAYLILQKKPYQSETRDSFYKRALLKWDLSCNKTTRYLRAHICLHQARTRDSNSFETVRRSISNVAKEPSKVRHMLRALLKWNAFCHKVNCYSRAHICRHQARARNSTSFETLRRDVFKHLPATSGGSCSWKM